MTTFQNKLTVQRFYNEVVNNRNFYLIDEYVADNFTDHNPEPGQPTGREGIRAMFHGFIEAFPNLTMKADYVVAENDLVGVRCTVTGTHLGTFNNIAATGRDVSVSGFDWVRLTNGKITERWGVFDMASMMQQIGAIPGPTTSDLKTLSTTYYKHLDGAKGDLASLRTEMLQPYLTTHFSGQPSPLNIDATQNLMHTFWKAFPDIRHEIKSQICEGNTVFNHLTVTATHKGDFAGVPATNKNLNIEVMTCQTWTDGRLAEQWVNLDLVSLLTQIGAIKR